MFRVVVSKVVSVIAVTAMFSAGLVTYAPVPSQAAVTRAARVHSAKKLHPRSVAGLVSTKGKPFRTSFPIGSTTTVGHSWTRPDLRHGRTDSTAVLGPIVRAFPAEGARIGPQVRLELAKPVSDSTGTTVSYDFTLYVQDISGPYRAIDDSGWFVPTDTVHPGFTLDPSLLYDGSIYYWTVKATDGPNNEDLNGTYWSFFYDAELGGRAQALDTLGPAQVNAASGDLTVRPDLPRVHSVGGEIGVGLVYHSQQPPQTGLNVAYYAADGSVPATFKPGAPYLNWVDASVDERGANFKVYQYGTNGNTTYVPGKLADWTGFITVPSDATSSLWQFGTTHVGAVRVFVDGHTAEDSWTDSVVSTPDFGPILQVPAGQTVPIEIQWYTKDRGATVALFAQNLGTSGTVTKQVPGDWLQPNQTSVPQGWTFGPNGSVGKYSSLKDFGQSVVMFGVDGGTRTFTATDATFGSGFKPPLGEYGTLARTLGNTLTYTGVDGTNSVFDASGSLISATTPLDDRHPAAPRLVRDSSGLLTALQDPIASNRQLGILYGGSSSCPTSPPLGLTAAPTGLLCALTYPDGSATAFYYTATRYYGRPELASILNPGNERTDYSYDSFGRMQAIRMPDANDWLAAGLVDMSDAVETQISYNDASLVTEVKAPAADGSASTTRTGHSYSFPQFGLYEVQKTSSQTVVSLISETPAGPVTVNPQWRVLGYDHKGRPVFDTDSAGQTTRQTWDDADVQTTSTTAAGVETVFTKIWNGQPTEVDGPTSAACLSGIGFTPGSELTYADTLLCGIPVTTYKYNEGIYGLAGTYWTNPDFAGAPSGHSTNEGRSDGIVNYDFTSHGPVGLSGISPQVTSNFSARFTGHGQLFGYVSLAVTGSGGAILYANDSPVLEVGSLSGTGGSLSASSNSYIGDARVRVDYVQGAGGGSLSLVFGDPSNNREFTPNYDLQTSRTDPLGRLTKTTYAYPELGQPSSTTVDAISSPGSSQPLALTTTSTYENTYSPNSFGRLLSTTLPKGPSTTTYDAYYPLGSMVVNPCVAGSAAVDQAGQLSSTTAADPDGPAALVGIEHEYVYDVLGQQVAVREHGNDGSVSAWQCRDYDSRGRVIRITDRNGVATTTDYSHPGSVITHALDSSGVAHTTIGVDNLLGEQVAYTDELGAETDSTYDLEGQLISTFRTLPGGARSEISRNVYTNGLLVATHDFSSGSDLTTTFAYDSAGRLGLERFPNAVHKSYAYDPSSGQLLSVSDSSGTGSSSKFTDTVTRDALSQILTDQFSEVNGRSVNHSYVYDGAGRLTSATDSGSANSATRNYSYDANSNRCSQSTDCTNPTSTYDTADRIQSSPGWGAYSYDQWGNETGATTSIPPSQTTTTDTAQIQTTPNPHDSVFQSLANGVTNATLATNPATTTGSQTVSPPDTQQYSQSVSTDGQSLLHANLIWSPVVVPVTNTGSANVPQYSTKTIAIGPTAAGDITGHVSWGPGYFHTHTVYKPTTPISQSFPVTIAGGTAESYTATASWPSASATAIALTLKDSTGKVVAVSTPTSATTTTLSYPLPGNNYESQTYNLGVSGLSIGQSVSLDQNIPAYAKMTLSLLDSGGNVLDQNALQPNRPLELDVSKRNLPAGQYQLVMATDASAPTTWTENHNGLQYAPVQAAWTDPSGKTISTQTSNTGAMSLDALAPSSGLWNLSFANTSTLDPLPSITSTYLATTAATATATGSNPASGQSIDQKITLATPGPISSSLTWTKGSTWSDLTATVLNSTGVVQATQRNATGALNLVTGSLPAGNYTVRISGNNTATGTYSLATAYPHFHAVLTAQLLDAAGNILPATFQGLGTPTVTMSANTPKGVYTIRTSNSGIVQNNQQLTATINAPAKNHEIALTYDGNDDATHIVSTTKDITETMAPTGRVLHRVVVDLITKQQVEDTWYGYGDDSDSPTYTRSGLNGPITTFGPEGATYTTGQTTTWSLTNLHGDVVATTDSTGTFTDTPLTDEFGIPYTPDTRDPAAPANRLGYLGTDKRFEIDTDNDVIRMGARLYQPGLGRFLQTDPIEGGSCNSYDYVCQNPINGLDLNGQLCYSCLVRHLRNAADDVGRYIVNHRSAIVSIAGDLACIGIVALGPLGCVVIQGVALTVRAQQTGITQYRKNLIDGLITALGLGLGGGVAAYEAAFENLSDATIRALRAAVTAPGSVADDGLPRR